MTVRILRGDCRDVLKTLPADSVHCVVTSPPYFGLRNYEVDAQIGLEPTPAEFLCAIVDVFREVRRVLRSDGTIWVNMGDSYAGSRSGPDTGSKLQGSRQNQNAAKDAKLLIRASFRRDKEPTPRSDLRVSALKPKDLMMMPARVALALQEDGWWLRQDIIWHKPNPMPESITDRCTKAHEYVFLLSKSERYYFDNEAIKEPASENTHARYKMPDGWDTGAGSHGSFHRNGREKGKTKLAPAGSGIKANESMAPAINGLTTNKNKRSVWTIATEAFPEAHFATFPTALAEPCILAGCPPGGVVLDPFGGAGTTGLVADRHGRDAILIELNPEYAAMAERRIRADAPLFAELL